MKLSILILLSAIVATSLTSCNSSQTTYLSYILPYQVGGAVETVTTSSGLQIYVVSRGAGTYNPSPQNYDYVELNINYEAFKDPSRLTYTPSYKYNPVFYPIRLGFDNIISGLEEGVAHLRQGDKARFIMPPSIGYGTEGVAGAHPFAWYMCDVEILTVTQNTNAITAFVTTGKDTINCPNKLKYIKCVEAPNGAKQAVDESQVTINYTGYLTNGTIFNSNIPSGTPYAFEVGKPNVIPAWNEVIRLMKVGDKFRVLVPYSLGFGPKSVGKVDPFSDLIYDIELLSVN